MTRASFAFPTIRIKSLPNGGSMSDASGGRQDLGDLIASGKITIVSRDRHPPVRAFQYELRAKLRCLSMAAAASAGFSERDKTQTAKQSAPR
jgi:hypothetical protein